MKEENKKFGCPNLIAHRYKFEKDSRLSHLLIFNNLEDTEKVFLIAKIFKEIKLQEGKIDPYVVFANTLHSWGIMCPHPKRKEFMTYSECLCCKALIPAFVKIFETDIVEEIIKSNTSKKKDNI